MKRKLLAVALAGALGFGIATQVYAVDDVAVPTTQLSILIEERGNLPPLVLHYQEGQTMKFEIISGMAFLGQPGVTSVDVQVVDGKLTTP